MFHTTTLFAFKAPEAYALKPLWRVCQTIWIWKPGFALLLVSWVTGSVTPSPWFSLPLRWPLRSFRWKSIFSFDTVALESTWHRDSIKTMCQMNEWVSFSELSGFYSVSCKLRLCPSSMESFSSTSSFLSLFYCCSVAKSWLTLRDPVNYSTPGFPVFHYFLYSQTHIHWVSDAIQPSHLLSPPSPLALKLSQNQGLFQWVSFLQ